MVRKMQTANQVEPIAQRNTLKIYFVHIGECMASTLDNFTMQRVLQSVTSAHNKKAAFVDIYRISDITGRVLFSNAFTSIHSRMSCRDDTNKDGHLGGLTEVV